ncbi:Outer membrane efflux protein [Natronincola peptidivorans]|uniref:Outer membrane efflux protein n=1 Tax=Natronincola peptidivorans TaxID=426128 RepID=A0A1I0CS95_9FIRM|nr:TolC family protein [Natronincola peptidivorans]SET22133.1 Outer membrane efflux protein [Natronincola peptidivorans]
MKKFTFKAKNLIVVIILLALSINFSYAQEMHNNINEIEQRILTYEEALEMALRRSYTARNAAADVERSQELRDQSAQDLRYSRPEGPGNDIQDLIARQELQMYLARETSLGMSKRQLEIINENIGFEINSIFNEIIKTENELELLDTQINTMGKKIQTMNLMVNNGLRSKLDYTTLNNQYQEVLKQQDILKKALDNQYIKLNKAIGLDEKERRLISKEINYEPLEELDIDLHINRMIARDPYIWNLEQQISLSQNRLSLYTYNANQEPYRALQIDKTKAENNVNSAKQNLRESLRLRYNQIQQLETQYRIQELKLKEANENFTILELRFELGMITKNDLLETETQLKSLEVALKNIIIQHEELKQLIAKPYLAPDYLN